MPLRRAPTVTMTYIKTSITVKKKNCIIPGTKKL